MSFVSTCGAGPGAMHAAGWAVKSRLCHRAGIVVVVSSSLLSLFANPCDLATHFHSGKAEIL